MCLVDSGFRASRSSFLRRLGLAHSVGINGWKVTQAFETENLEKLPRRSIEDRPAKRVVAARDAHQASLHQLPQQVAALDAANGLHVGAHDRLTVADDGESFQCGPAQA